MKDHLQFYINGQWVAPATPRTPGGDQSLHAAAHCAHQPGLGRRCGRRRQSSPCIHAPPIEGGEIERLEEHLMKRRFIGDCCTFNNECFHSAHRV